MARWLALPFPLPARRAQRRAPFLWANGKMHDLNALVPPHSPLDLLIAYAINDSKEIGGLGCVPDTCNTSSPTFHAFLATPCDRTNTNTEWCKNDGDSAAPEAESTVERPTVSLSQTARQMLQYLWHPGQSGAQLMGSQ